MTIEEINRLRSGVGQPRLSALQEYNKRELERFKQFKKSIEEPKIESASTAPPAVVPKLPDDRLAILAA